jgi:outer membrane protease
LYEKRGTGLSLGNGESLNKGDDIEVTKISGGYLFGQSDSVAKIKVEIGNLQSKYQTRRDTTYLLDKETGFFDVSFDYLLSGQSYLSSNIGFEKVESKNNAVLDNERYIALMGLKWQTTLISQFSFLLGYQAIKFENATFADDNAFKWRVDLNWHPINFTKIAFRTERDFEEANRLSDSYRVVDKYEFKLTSEISDFFQVVAILGMNKEQIVYQQDKEDEDYIFSQVQLNYQRTEWLSFFIKYEYNDLDSTESEYNYQRNSISIGFNASL